jgi:MoaA/NifB/PqqE/SkfB family radical SAM enzyme
MEWELFAEIMERQPPGHFKVSLQGEGEPITHPRFWELVELVARIGKIPYTITNCSLLDANRAAMVFPEIGISLDTLDPGEAQRIGRYELAKVLRNLEALIESMGPDRIIVHTVDYGQPLEELRSFLGARGIGRHMIQPLQSKADYSYRYPDRLPAQVFAYHYRCKYVMPPIMRYYHVDGREMPCCFIKDAAAFESTAQILADLRQRRLPASCNGCREIFGRTP